MTTLALSRDCLTTPMRLDLALVEGAMLWPRDEPARQQWMNAAMTVEAVARADGMSAAMLRDALSRAASTPPLAELQKSAGDRYAHGWVTGAVLRRAVAAGRNGGEVQLGGIENVSTGEITPGIITDLARDVAKFRVAGKVHATPGVKTIYKIWYEFRGVSAYWAAYEMLAPDNHDKFPCTIAGFHHFLKVAKRFRLLGLSTNTAKGPLLPPDECVMEPDFIDADDIEIEFVPRELG